MNTNAIPLVLVAHGSRDGRSSAVVRRIAARLGARASFIEFDRPDPVTLIGDLASAGHRTVVVVPLLLTEAFHGRVDVPRILAEVRERRPGLTVLATPTVGGAELVPALVRPLPPDYDAVVLAHAGTRDEPSREGVREVARRLGAYVGVKGRAAYAASAEPSVSDAVNELKAAGAKKVAVAAYFIAPGLLYERARAGAVEAGAVDMAPPLADCPELLDAVRARYRGALAGSGADGALQAAA